jgi:hypothetical protein
MLDRRAFVSGSAAMLAAPLAVWAQQAGKVARIGVTLFGPPEASRT